LDGRKGQRAADGERQCTERQGQLIGVQLLLPRDGHAAVVTPQVVQNLHDYHLTGGHDGQQHAAGYDPANRKQNGRVSPTRRFRKKKMNKHRRRASF